MEPELKKEHKVLPILLTVLIMLLLTAAVAGGVWYYMDQQAKKTADDNAKQVAELQRQVDALNKDKTTTDADETTTDTTAGWKTYSGNGYSIKYPTNWYLTSSTLQSWAPTTNGRGGLSEGMSKIDLRALDSYSGITTNNLKTAVDQSLAQWRQGNTDRGNTSFTVKSTEKLTINGKEAYLVVTHSSEAGSATQYTIYVMENGALRSLAIISGEIPTSATDAEIRSMIKTFNLI